MRLEPIRGKVVSLALNCYLGGSKILGQQPPLLFMFIPINKVIISYSRKDLSKVKSLMEKLREANIDAFLDIDDITAGVDWEKSLESAIANAYAMIFVMSKSSLISPYCMDELRIALNNDVPILPILVSRETISIPEELPTDIGETLRTANRVFLWKDKPDNAPEFRKLINELLQIDAYRGELDKSPKATITTYCRLPDGRTSTDYFLLTSKLYTFGRNPESTMQNSVIKFSCDPTVSSRHAVFTWNRRTGTYSLRDGSLQGDRPSSFGTYVECTMSRGIAMGGRKLGTEPHPLKNLEVVRTGKNSFFCFELAQSSTIQFDAKETLTNAID